MPYWWNRKADSLAATIYRARPDVFASKPEAFPIPYNPPSKNEVTSQSGIFYFRYLSQ